MHCHSKIPPVDLHGREPTSESTDRQDSRKNTTTLWKYRSKRICWRPCWQWVGIRGMPAFACIQIHLIVLLLIALLCSPWASVPFPGQCKCTQLWAYTAPVICCANKIITTANSPHGGYILQSTSFNSEPKTTLHMKDTQAITSVTLFL